MLTKLGWTALVVAGVCGQAIALSAWKPVNEVSLLEERAAASPSPCVRAFSKDACAGAFEGGHGSFTSCSISTTPCDTLSVYGQKWQFALKSNPNPSCGDPAGVVGRCDEVKDGRFEASVDFVLRMNQPCRYRGCLEGEAVYYSEDGAIYSGRVMGTMGAGTDRSIRCPVTSQPPFLPQGCEKCHDVELQSGTGTTQVWRVGVDAAFHGVRVDADTGEKVCITISGDFFAKGNGQGIFDPVNGWVYYGNADGVYTYLCP